MAEEPVPVLGESSSNWGARKAGLGSGLGSGRSPQAPVRSQGTWGPWQDMEHLNSKDEEPVSDALLSQTRERLRRLHLPAQEQHERLLQSWLFHRWDPQDPAGSRDRLDPPVTILPGPTTHSEIKVMS